MEKARRVQQYRNPLKWGWYYIEGPRDPMTGMMSKRAARRMMREHPGRFGYGHHITYHSNAPRLKLFRRLGFPIKNIAIM